MNIVLGKDDYFGVPFPLVLADRFFHIYSTASGFKLDIFRWDEESKEPVYEVKASKPLDDGIDSNPDGVTTFDEPTPGNFLYKFRPKREAAQIPRKKQVNIAFDVKINDRLIDVTVNGDKVCTFQSNQFQRTTIGIQIHADGAMGVGVKKLPDGMTLTRG
jgi:hypothetical protein